jgi:MoaA/NifB/PqqE/SkfB family radical SAM enzyme
MRKTRLGVIYVPPHVVLRTEKLYQSWIAFNAKTSTTFELSSTEYFFLEQLQQVGLENEEFGVVWPTVSAAENHEDRRTKLIEGGILDLSMNPRFNVIRTDSIESEPAAKEGLAFLSSPTELELCLTRRCNQKCFHCNVSAVSLAQLEKLNTEFWLNLLDQAELHRILRVTLTGGEPFARADINVILKHISEKPFATIILSNGTLITDDQIDIIKNSPITLSVSIDGINAEQHDAFRRSPGGFEATVKNLRKLSEANVRFVVSSVLHQGNIKNATDFLTLANDVGASKLVIVPMAAVGRAKSPGSSEQFPIQEDLLHAVSELQKIAMESPGLDIIIGNPDPSNRELIAISDRSSGVTAMSKRNPGLCKAGVYSMAVDEDGLVYSCLRGLQERIYPIGDLKQQCLSDIWSKVAWDEFRDTGKPMVPCRVEEIGNRPKIATSV